MRKQALFLAPILSMIACGAPATSLDSASAAKHEATRHGGAPCATDEDCRPGRCVELVCSSLSEPKHPSGDCADKEDCGGPELLCTDSVCIDPREPGSAGDDCDDDCECNDDLLCIDDACQAAPTGG